MGKKVKTTIQDPFLEREAQKYDSPIPSREYILSLLEESSKPIKRQALFKMLALESEDQEEGLRRRLKAMVRDGQLFKSPQGYVPIMADSICQGTLVMERDGDGYVEHQGERIYLSGWFLRGFYEGDVLEVQATQLDEEGRKKGRILKLITAIAPKVVGRFVKQHQLYEVVSLERKITQKIVIPKEFKEQAQDGDIVHVEILRDEKYATHETPVGKIIEILGDLAAPGIEVKMAIRKFKVPEEWPKAVLKEAKQFEKAKIQPQENRKDLTQLPLVTIDGEDAKDFDDAVYCEKTKDGWRLYVAIADVSYYVRPQSALDQEAKYRGNSTYFPGSVIPMLPEILSNELCSLKPNVLRYCVVCQMSLSNDGEVKRATFYRALMKSQARLTYTEVAAILNGDEVLREQRAALVPHLTNLHALYQLLLVKRTERGAIDFDTIETKILFDTQGKIKSIIPAERNVAHKIIEECMLAANVSAAKYLQRHKVKTLYRVHDIPPADKLKSLREFLAELGMGLPGQKQPSSKDFVALIKSIQQRDDRHMIETVLLRSLSQAQYSPKNVGHFGLAYPSYLHFTSPIRRYPDLIVHRGITDTLLDKDAKNSSLNNIDFEKLGMACSDSERRSDEATRDAQMALKCHFMQDKVGEHYQGVISGVASFGIFVELKGIYIEGLVHVTSLGGEYFHYDAAHHRMIGDRSRTVYRLGDKVEVIVARVDVETKRIDLDLANVERAPRVARKKHEANPPAKENEKKRSKKSKRPSKAAKQRKANKQNKKRRPKR